MTDDLLPCPFCGDSNPDPCGWASANPAGPVICDGCGASVPLETWNRRAAMPPAPAPQTEFVDVCCYCGQAEDEAGPTCRGMARDHLFSRQRERPVRLQPEAKETDR